MQTRYAAILLSFVPGLTCAQSVSERAAQDQIVNMKNEEPAMRRAFEKARATLDDFLAKAKQPPGGTGSYALKVAVRDGADTEYFWVNQFTWSGDSFTGSINNTPRLVKNVRRGQMYTFSRSQIVDWTYVDEQTRKTLGNFTACAILTKEPPAEAEAFKRRYGLDCS